MAESAPIAVGGVSGSGTRIIARILQEAGIYIGSDLNESLDNLWFTLLFKHPFLLPRRVFNDELDLMGGLAVFEKAMEGTLKPNRTVRRHVDLVAKEVSRHGINHRRDGHGNWVVGRVTSLLNSARTHPSVERWGWKEPCTMLLLIQLNRYFPTFRYVHVMRHPLDMAFRRDQQDACTWGPLFGLHPPYEPGPSVPLKYWLAANEQVLEQGEMLLGDRFLAVRLEELSVDPRAGVRALLDFADVRGDGSLVDRLAALPTLPSSAGQYRHHDLSIFTDQDLDRVRALGFEVDVDRGRPRPDTTAYAPSPKPTIAVAMCTYNGERFLAQQLASIAAQTRPPDELVICDDGSSDGTMRMIEEFHRAAPFDVRIELNPRNLGSTRNFEKAIGLCDADFIFLSDQDDIWLPWKLERLSEALSSSGECAAVFSDAYLIDEESRPLGRGLWESYGFVGHDRELFRRGEGFHRLLRSNVVTGATMGFRASFRDLLLPIPQLWVHDGWIATLLAGVSRLALTPERFMSYRVHSAQQIGVPEPWQIERPRLLPPLAFKALTKAQNLQRRAQLKRRMRKNTRAAMRHFSEYLRPLYERLHGHIDRYPARAGVLPALDDVRQHNIARGEMELARRRWPLIREEFRSGRYALYSNGLSSAVKDLLLLDRRWPRNSHSRSAEPADDREAVP